VICPPQNGENWQSGRSWLRFVLIGFNSCTYAIGGDNLWWLFKGVLHVPPLKISGMEVNGLTSTVPLDRFPMNHSRPSWWWLCRGGIVPSRWPTLAPLGDLGKGCSSATSLADLGREERLAVMADRGNGQGNQGGDRPAFVPAGYAPAR